jgi:hypothetical protein
VIQFTDIYAFIIAQEAKFFVPISVIDGVWDWSMREHIKTSMAYKHGRLLTGNSDDKPVKNITRPILNLAYRAEDIDVKDIHIYVNDYERFHLSFLIKKYHDEVFLKENDLDTFFDEIKEEKIDFGGALCKKMRGARPVKIPLQSIAFCNQSDILSAPFGIKHFMSIDALKDMELAGWGKPENNATVTVDELIALSYKQSPTNKSETKTTTNPGEDIEVYEVRGYMPEEWIENNEVTNSNKYEKQLQIVAFYILENGNKQGVTLYAKKDTENNIKYVSRDPIFGRALGFGGAEELFEPQVWTNYSEIRKKDMIDAAAKTILKTTDPGLATRGKVKDMENMEMLTLADGTDVSQVDTFPRNIRLFTEWMTEWEEHAQRTGSASDANLGDSPTSGTPFRLQQQVIAQGKGLHEYRRGKFAKFIEEIYQDWIIPHIASEIVKGSTFLAELTADEMEYISDCLMRSEINKFIIENILAGQVVDETMVEMQKEKIKQQFMQGGPKRFFRILKNEMKGVEMKVKVNVAGKQKDLVGVVDKLTNIFREVFANPQILDDPRAAKIFGKILEFSGLDPIDFQPLSYTKPKPQLSPPNGTPSPMQPLQELTKQ